MKYEDKDAFDFLLFLCNFPVGLTKQDFEIIKKIKLLEEQQEKLMDKLIDYKVLVQYFKYLNHNN